MNESLTGLRVIKGIFGWTIPLTYATRKDPTLSQRILKQKPDNILKKPPLLQVFARDGGGLCRFSHMKASTSECMSAALRSGWWERAQWNPEE